MRKRFPLAVRKILEQITENSYQCYLVGGCVRDLLLSQEPVDYDFVTDRLPEEVKKTAHKAGWKAWEQGASFGVVNVVVDGVNFEVATMRTETYGTDPHRPETVKYLQNLAGDLSRRDFTINAMAMNINGHVIDPFGGQNDMERKLVRTVGEPQVRFLEDPLRLLRAPRIAACIGFTVDPAILEASQDQAVRKRFSALSVERVRDELEKILLAPQAAEGLKILLQTSTLENTCRAKTGGEKEDVFLLPEVVRLQSIKQNPRFHRYNVLEHTLQTVNLVKPELSLNWAALLHDIAKGAAGVRTLNKKGEIADYGHAREGASMARDILERLRVSRSVTQHVTWLIRHHMDLNFVNEKSAVRWVKKRAKEFSGRDNLLEAIRRLCLLAEADNIARGMGTTTSFLPEMSQMLENIIGKIVLYPKELEISGDFVADKLGEGPQVGKVLQDLLVDVQSGRLQNKRESLQDAVLKKARRQKQQLQ